MSNSQPASAPVSPNIAETKFIALGSPLSEFQPKQDVTTEASVNLTPEAADNLIESA